MFELLSVLAIIVAVYYFVKAKFFKWCFEQELKKHVDTTQRLVNHMRTASRHFNENLELRREIKESAKNSDAILDAEIIG